MPIAIGFPDMPKLERVENLPVEPVTEEPQAQASDQEWEELEDGSKAVTLSPRFGSKRVVLREMTGADLVALDKMPEGQREMILRLVCRLCTQWGEENGVTLKQLYDLPVRELVKVTRVAESFL